MKPVKVTSRLPDLRPVDIVEKKSEFALRTVIIYSEGIYRNQRDEIVARASAGASALSGRSPEKGEIQGNQAVLVD